METETVHPPARKSKLAIAALVLSLLPILVILCLFAFSFFTDWAPVSRLVKEIDQWYLIRENIQFFLLLLACILPPGGILLGIISLFRRNLRRGPAIAGILTGILIQLAMCALILYVMMARA